MKRIRLHLGAHRTATTRLQSVLDANADLLGRHGIAVFTPPRTGRFDAATIRDLLGDEVFARVRRLRTKRTSILTSGPWLLRRRAALHRFLAAPGADEIIISEENLLLENATHLLTSALYGTARRRLAAVRRMLPVPVERVFLATRDYASFHESWYTVAARYGVLPAEDEVRFSVLARVRERRCGWDRVVRAIRRALPAAAVEVWRQDGYDETARLQSLVGRSGLTFERPAGRPNASAGRKAIRRLQRARAARPLAHDEADAIVQEAAREGDTPVRFFEDGEREELHAAYERDLAAIGEGGVSVRGI